VKKARKAPKAPKAPPGTAADMTMRQWFAGIALSGLVLEWAQSRSVVDIPTMAKEIVRDAWLFADEMMAQETDPYPGGFPREKQTNQETGVS